MKDLKKELERIEKKLRKIQDHLSRVEPDWLQPVRPRSGRRGRSTHHKDHVAIRKAAELAFLKRRLFAKAKGTSLEEVKQ